MTRIDQAWRRALRVPAAPRDAEPSTFDDYPAEAPGSVVAADLHQDRPAPPRVVAIPPAAAEMRVSRSFSAPDPATVDAALAASCRRMASTLSTRTAGGPKDVVVTSVVQTADKARATLQLAQTLASMLSERVLILDLDTTPPFVHDLLTSDQHDAQAPVAEQGIIAITPLLHLLPPRRDNSASMSLLSGKWDQLIGRASGNYEWTLVNAPAVSALPDGQMLGGRSSHLVVTIDAATPFPLVGKTLESLGRERIAGTLLVGLG